MSEPLDLRALEARLQFGDSLDAAECGALIAALRAHRAALAAMICPWCGNPHPTAAGLCVNGDKCRHAGHRVLASCTDREGAPVTQE